MTIKCAVNFHIWLDNYYRELTQRTKMRSCLLSLALTTTHYQRCSEREVYVSGVCLLKSLKSHSQNSKQHMGLWPWVLDPQHQGTVIQYYQGRKKCIKGLKAAPWFYMWTSSGTCSGVRGLGYYHSSRKQQYIKIYSVISGAHKIFKETYRLCSEGWYTVFQILSAGKMKKEYVYPMSKSNMNIQNFKQL